VDTQGLVFKTSCFLKSCLTCVKVEQGLWWIYTVHD